MSLTTLFVRWIEVLKTNLPSEHKRMQKFTEVACGEREKSHSPHFCHNDKSNKVMESNLHAEH